MKAVLRSTLMLLFILFLFSMPATAQNGLNNVHLFQSYFFDAPIATTVYGEGGLEYATSSQSSVSSNTLFLNAKAGYPVNEKIEAGAQIGFTNYSVKVGSSSSSESGLNDLGIYGRYNITQNKQLNFSAGGMITLPIGSDKIGEGNLDFGFYGAVRYQLENGLVLAGNLGIIFYEYQTMETKQTGPNPWDVELVKGSDRDNYLNLGIGGIYPINEQLNAVGELVLKSGMNYTMLSAGADYLLGSGRVRGALGLGLDDAAPDFQIMASYGLTF
ncbi:MAG: hypothetical protein GXO74_03555 [Calditrichaeota bacterium]|nr:hypothetical protein [Calditrichota bacterium]